MRPRLTIERPKQINPSANPPLMVSESPALGRAAKPAFLRGLGQALPSGFNPAAVPMVSRPGLAASPC